MSDVDFGTGTTKNVFNAPTTGSSTLKECAFLFLTNATPSISQETVFLATLATIWSMELASSPPSKPPLTLAVQPGTGKTKNASNAQTTGSSKTEPVCLSQTNATPSTSMETVFHATKATT